MQQLNGLIACPNADHGDLTIIDDNYVCTTCGGRYEIRNGIPVLLPTGH